CCYIGICVLESATTSIFGTTSSSDAEAGAKADNIRIARLDRVDNLRSAGSLFSSATASCFRRADGRTRNLRFACAELRTFPEMHRGAGRQASKFVYQCISKQRNSLSVRCSISASPCQEIKRGARPVNRAVASAQSACIFLYLRFQVLPARQHRKS